MIRTKRSGLTPERTELLRQLALRPDMVAAELARRSLYTFIQEFWSEVSSDEPHWNWHIPYLCTALMTIAERVGAGQPKRHDLIINVPPGTTKSITASIMFPVWCWTRWPWMRFIVGSYSSALSLEHAELSRELVRSDRFHALFPYLDIKQDKDTKSNFRIVERLPTGLWRSGGNRYSTSVGGTLTGFHGHILIVDDPLNPKESASDLKIKTANHWMEQTLSTRKVDKATTPTILIMQRLHQDDPTGHWLTKQKSNVFHISLPGEIRSYADQVRPIEAIGNYVDNLLDPVRMPWPVLEDLQTDLGQYGYAGQIGQNPVPPGGGMFRAENFAVVDSLPTPANISQTVRYWDKGSTSKGGDYTVGVKMARLRSGYFVVVDVRRGQWSADERERIIRSTAEADGQRVLVFTEQEPGSGGKESAQATIRNLAGFSSFADRPTGDKTFRADPYSVQVNNGNVQLLRGPWNHAFVEEHRYFPFGTYDDQVDASSGCFAALTKKRLVQRVI